ncbi:unnamed protein product [Prunus armeniaca]|uniref:Uncharacterized protein n=1 Tax=Prunus armeniaca TaxID=36596 RepID=A0A6J5VD88_PRUAR|nr:unnamed protein product [Prunus armeniaca]
MRGLRTTTRGTCSSNHFYQFSRSITFRHLHRSRFLSLLSPCLPHRPHPPCPITSALLASTLCTIAPIHHRGNRSPNLGTDTFVGFIYGLVAQVLTDQPVNHDDFIKTITQLWKGYADVSIKEIGFNSFQQLIGHSSLFAGTNQTHNSL